MFDALPYREIWAVDFEFGSEPGEPPTPVCLVAWELKSRRKLRLWRDQFRAAPPYAADDNALFVAYYASAEIGCHLALGWPVPERVLDLFTEFRNRTNGVPADNGDSLLGALAFHGLDGIGAIEKDKMRALVLRGGSWSVVERSAILDYCEADVEALARLLPALNPENGMATLDACNQVKMVFEGRNQRNDADLRQISLRCDDTADITVVTPDNDQEPVFALVDWKRRGKTEGIVYDLQRSGKWNTSIWDPQLDGTFPLRGVHPNGELMPNSLVPRCGSRKPLKDLKCA